MGAKVSVSASEVSASNKGHDELPYHRSVREFTKLKSVVYARNGMVRFPKQLGPDLRTYPPLVDTLQELDLSSNELESLPDEMCFLVNLRKLKLEGNRLNRLPAGFPGLYKLEKAYLNDNLLTEMPLDMANMTALRVLRLHANKLFWLPNDVGKLRLEELTIHENPLRTDVLELGELDDVLEYFRTQSAPVPYSKALKAHIITTKIKDGLHELKEGRLHAFRVILASEDAKSFQAFLEKEFAVENLHFYRDADVFRSRFSSNFPIVSKELKDAGLVVYKKYIEEVPEEHKVAINIPISVKKKIDEAFAANSTSPPDQWVFTDAYVAIAKLMFEDSFKRFLETSEGQRIWSIYESHSQVGRKRSEKKKGSSSSSAEGKKKTKEEMVDSDESEE